MYVFTVMGKILFWK